MHAHSGYWGLCWWSGWAWTAGAGCRLALGLSRQRLLIVAPTREVALQTRDVCRLLGAHLRVCPRIPAQCVHCGVTLPRDVGRSWIAVSAAAGKGSSRRKSCRRAISREREVHGP